jgi:hypothetical protein
MKWIIALGALLLAAPLAAADKGEGHGKAVTVAPTDLKWGPAPPGLPEGGQVAVLNGNPMKAGEFAIRLKMPDGYTIAPHWHTQAEELTVLSGTLMLNMGDKQDPATATALVPGAFHSLPGKMHHAAQAKGETIVQITGKGPFDIHYLNAADDPRKGKAGGGK